MQERAGAGASGGVPLAAGAAVLPHRVRRHRHNLRAAFTHTLSASAQASTSRAPAPPPPPPYPLRTRVCAHRFTCPCEPTAAAAVAAAVDGGRGGCGAAAVARCGEKVKTGINRRSHEVARFKVAAAGVEREMSRCRGRIAQFGVLGGSTASAVAEVCGEEPVLKRTAFLTFLTRTFLPRT